MRIAIAAVALAVATPFVIAAAPQQIPGVADVSRVTAGTYSIDPNHTQVTYTVNHLGFSMFDGQIGGATGALSIDPANPGAARVEVTFDMNQLHSPVEALDHHLKTADFFDVATYPTAHFVSTGVTVNGTEAQIAGNLTIHGVTRPATLDARFVGAGTNPMNGKKTIGFEATTTIDRTEFGITAYSPALSDAVKLHINAAFEAE